MSNISEESTSIPKEHLSSLMTDEKTQATLEMERNLQAINKKLREHTAEYRFFEYDATAFVSKRYEEFEEQIEILAQSRTEQECIRTENKKLQDKYDKAMEKIASLEKEIKRLEGELKYKTEHETSLEEEKKELVRKFEVETTKHTKTEQKLVVMEETSTKLFTSWKCELKKAIKDIKDQYARTEERMQKEYSERVEIEVRRAREEEQESFSQEIEMMKKEYELLESQYKELGRTFKEKTRTSEAEKSKLIMKLKMMQDRSTNIEDEIAEYRRIVAEARDIWAIKLGQKGSMLKTEKKQVFMSKTVEHNTATETTVE